MRSQRCECLHSTGGWLDESPGGSSGEHWGLDGSGWIQWSAIISQVGARDPSGSLQSSAWLLVHVPNIGKRQWSSRTCSRLHGMLLIHGADIAQGMMVDHTTICFSFTRHQRSLQFRLGSCLKHVMGLFQVFISNVWLSTFIIQIVFLWFALWYFILEAQTTR